MELHSIDDGYRDGYFKHLRIPWEQFTIDSAENYLGSYNTNKRFKGFGAIHCESNASNFDVNTRQSWVPNFTIASSACVTLSAESFVQQSAELFLADHSGVLLEHRGDCNCSKGVPAEARLRNRPT